MRYRKELKISHQLLKLSVMVILIGNEIGDQSSNPRLTVGVTLHAPALGEKDEFICSPPTKHKL